MPVQKDIMNEEPRVWAFDLGKGSIGEAVRSGNEFLHNEAPPDYTAKKVQVFRCTDVVRQLAERGIDFPEVAAQPVSRTPPHTICCPILPSTPALARRQRSVLLKAPLLAVITQRKNSC